jgi:SNF2 family DNA or RNA helicase
LHHKLGLKIGVLAGQPIFGQSSEDRQRDAVVKDLNEGRLDGVIMTEKVGACGHNLVGGNNIIFDGSLYSQAFESQAIGTSQ